MYTIFKSFNCQNSYIFIRITIKPYTWYVGALDYLGYEKDFMINYRTTALLTTTTTTTNTNTTTPLLLLL